MGAACGSDACRANPSASTAPGFTLRHRAGRVLIAIGVTFSCACSARPGAVGAVFAQSRTDGTVVVRETPHGLPAAQAGIAPGDELLLVDGHDVRSLSPLHLHALLQGPVDSTVRLTLLSKGRIARVQVVRGPIRERSQRPR